MVSTVPTEGDDIMIEVLLKDPVHYLGLALLTFSLGGLLRHILFSFSSKTRFTVFFSFIYLGLLIMFTEHHLAAEYPFLNLPPTLEDSIFVNSWELGNSSIGFLWMDWLWRRRQ